MRTNWHHATIFLSRIHGNIVDPANVIELRGIPEHGGQVRSVFCPDLAAAEEQIRRLTKQPGLNVYGGIATRRDDSSGKTENLGRVGALWIDVDLYKRSDGSGGRAEELQGGLRDFPLQPSLEVWSGNGLHAYWLLRHPIDLREQEILATFVATQCGLAAHFGTDTMPVAQPMRVAGTINYPSESKRKKYGLQPTRTFIRADRGHRYLLSDFSEYCHGVSTGRPVSADPPGADIEIPDEPSEGVQKILNHDPETRARYEGSTDGLRDCSASGVDLSLASRLAHRACSKSEIIAALILSRRSRREQLKGADYYLRTADKALASVESHRNQNRPDSDRSTEVPATRQLVRAESPGSARPPLHELLEQIESMLRCYMAFSSRGQAVACTLWVAHTYVFQQTDVTPYLAITSAEKRSGKTRLLDVLELLANNSWRAVMPSEPVVFRKIARDAPTLLLDEVDALYGPKAREHEGLRALLNAGNRRGTTVPRCVNAGADLQDFEVYCPKAVAGIGNLPDTLADRSIPIRLNRRAPTEAIQRFRRRNAEAECRIIAQGLVAWAETATLAAAHPEIPGQLDDRAADGWEPLLAIADLAGEGWPARARAAAVALHVQVDDGERSVGIRLLQDVRTIFADRDCEKIFTKDLIADLNDIEESPWGDWRGKGLGPQSLARLLQPYGIKPAGTLRITGDTNKGYLRPSFEDAWARYLPRDGIEPSQRHNCPADEEPSLFPEGLQPSHRHTSAADQPSHRHNPSDPGTSVDPASGPTGSPDLAVEADCDVLTDGGDFTLVDPGPDEFEEGVI